MLKKKKAVRQQASYEGMLLESDLWHYAIVDWTHATRVFLLCNGQKPEVYGLPHLKSPIFVQPFKNKKQG
jgi:hypothetical protein